MGKKVLVLPGDGIGPEIVTEARKVLDVVNARFDLGLEISEALVGGAAIDATGVPLPDETLAAANRPMRFCWVPWVVRNGIPTPTSPSVRKRVCWVSAPSCSCSATCVRQSCIRSWRTPLR
jgi:Isocitrate/isopropylmalate dehydrogenase